MAERVIDYDRGVIIRSHAISGMDVYMYVDEPGRYLTAHGTEVPEQIAKEAGYDVEKLAKDRVRKERKIQATEAIDRELSDEQNVVEDVVAERNGFKLVSIGLGRHHLKDPEGNQLTGQSLPYESGMKLLDSMAGKEVEVPVVKQVEKNAK